MPTSSLHKIRVLLGSERIRLVVGLFLGGAIIGGLISVLPVESGMIVAFLPAVLLLVAGMIRRPYFGLFAALTLSFFAAGITRYIPLSWGLAVDFILAFCILGLIFQKYRTPDWKILANDAILLAGIWFAYLLIEIINPEAPGPVAWAYAVRGIGMYNLFVFMVAFVYLRDRGDITKFIHWIFVLSIIGAFWGFRQQFIGLDGAEEYWMFEEGHHDEHILHGVLRVFSFYSDAGQFGASQAMIALMCGVLVMGPFSIKRKFFYVLTAVICMLGFLYSGTRGALAVPAAGVLVYLVMSKNFKILIAGLVGIGLVFGILKYTFLFHSFQPVARLRTALSVDNPSLQARLNNQVTFGNYLRSRPLGGGVGSAGYWGERFRPGSLLAETPTDSYYVKIWAETGLVGLCLHLFVLGYFLGKGGVIVWNLRDPHLRYEAMALLSAYGGVLLASYGNQVYSQFPTGIIMPIALPLIFLSPHFDRQVAAKRIVMKPLRGSARTASRWGSMENPEEPAPI